MVVRIGEKNSLICSSASEKGAEGGGRRGKGGGAPPTSAVFALVVPESFFSHKFMATGKRDDCRLRTFLSYIFVFFSSHSQFSGFSGRSEE